MSVQVEFLCLRMREERGKPFGGVPAALRPRRVQGLKLEVQLNEEALGSLVVRRWRTRGQEVLGVAVATLLMALLAGDFAVLAGILPLAQEEHAKCGALSSHVRLVFRLCEAIQQESTPMYHLRPLFNTIRSARLF